MKRGKQYFRHNTLQSFSMVKDYPFTRFLTVKITSRRQNKEFILISDSFLNFVLRRVPSENNCVCSEVIFRLDSNLRIWLIPLFSLLLLSVRWQILWKEKFMVVGLAQWFDSGLVSLFGMILFLAFVQVQRFSFLLKNPDLLDFLGYYTSKWRLWTRSFGYVLKELDFSS